jgi:hypothetical protein
MSSANKSCFGTDGGATRPANQERCIDRYYLNVLTERCTREVLTRPRRPLTKSVAGADAHACRKKRQSNGVGVA